MTDLTDEFQAVRKSLYEAEVAHAAGDRDATLDAAYLVMHCAHDLWREVADQDPADAEIREQIRLDGIERKKSMERA